MTELCACGCGQPTPLAKRTQRRLGLVRGEPLRFVRGHNSRAQQPIKDRLLARIDVDDTTGCWVWRRPGLNGYGRLSVDGVELLAHRLSYETFVGAIPDGLQLDHLCRNRACIRPDHLEPVAQQVNVRRGADAKTHCPAGHPRDDEHTYVRRDRPGYRQCRTCSNENRRAARARRRQEQR